MDISHIATGRDGSFLTEDMVQAEPKIRAAVTDKRVLCVGAAGSIGSHTAAVISNYAPACLHIVDQNENALTDFVRAFRTMPHSKKIADFRSLPLDYGSNAMRLFLVDNSPYDLILNFAAIKHVRSEKDSFSILQMFDTNIVKQARFLKFLAEISFSGRYFSVSTDKAANPSSMMGATKRVMEHVLMNDLLRPDGATITSARFANVAFSNGSLLQSFESRLQRNELLAAPKDTRRYFVSLKESGQLCTLAACVGEHGSIAIPALNPEEHLVLLEDVAKNFLATQNLKPMIFSVEEEALNAMANGMKEGVWPLLLTPLDTAGEKPYEEFVAVGESVHDMGLPNLKQVSYLATEKTRVQVLLNEVEEVVCHAKKPASKEELMTIIGRLEPEFLKTHVNSQNLLDNRV